MGRGPWCRVIREMEGRDVVGGIVMGRGRGIAEDGFGYRIGGQARTQRRL